MKWEAFAELLNIKNKAISAIKPLSLVKYKFINYGFDIY
jgi:hypothetical protein